MQISPGRAHHTRLGLTNLETKSGSTVPVPTPLLPKKGRLKTVDTGTWNSFKWHPTLINLGTISPGLHTIEIRLGSDGNYGASPDVFEIKAN